MKKILLISLLFIGCRESTIKESEEIIISYDGCEYLKFQLNEGYILSHKGNCKNPRHYFKDNNVYKYNIVLPEEYFLISSEKTKPDTLTAYASRDTIYFQFDNYRNGNTRSP